MLSISLKRPQSTVLVDAVVTGLPKAAFIPGRRLNFQRPPSCFSSIQLWNHKTQREFIFRRDVVDVALNGGNHDFRINESGSLLSGKSLAGLA
jgi:hypothetical protein